MTIQPKSLFQLGQLMMTPGVVDAIDINQVAAYLALRRAGEWGCVCDEVEATNDEALREGFRILSAYLIDPSQPCKGHGDNTVWVITEADRGVTTLLLPPERGGDHEVNHAKRQSP